MGLAETFKHVVIGLVACTKQDYWYQKIYSQSHRHDPAVGHYTLDMARQTGRNMAKRVGYLFRMADQNPQTIDSVVDTGADNHNIHKNCLTLEHVQACENLPEPKTILTGNG